FHERFSAGYTERMIHAVGGRRMRSFYSYPLACLLPVFFETCVNDLPSSCASAQEAANPVKQKIDENALRKLIAQLGDDSFEKREAADQALAEMGSQALPFLRKAAADAADLEVRERAAKLIRLLTEGNGVLNLGRTV